MGMWKMTPAYKAWLILGMATIVAVLIALGLSDPSNQNVVFVALVLVAVYLAGIFFFQFRMVDRVEHEVRAPASGPAAPAPVSGDNPPADYRELMALLAVEPIDSAAQRDAVRGTTGVVRSQMRYGVVLCIAILVGMALFYAGVGGVMYPLGGSGPGFPVALVPVFVLIVYGVARIPFNLAAARASSDAYLEPLGLVITQMPEVGVRPRYGGSGMQSHVSGPTVMAGRRHGRPVEVRIEARESELSVGQRTPEFELTGEDERLTVAPGAPAAVREAIEPIGRDRRWKRVEVAGGSDGVVVKRRFRGSQHTQWLWMADLWLAERLADAAARK